MWVQAVRFLLRPIGVAVLIYALGSIPAAAPFSNPRASTVPTLANSLSSPEGERL